MNLKVMFFMEITKDGGHTVPLPLFVLPEEQWRSGDDRRLAAYSFDGYVPVDKVWLCDRKKVRPAKPSEYKDMERTLNVVLGNGKYPGRVDYTIVDPEGWLENQG